MQKKKLCPKCKGKLRFIEHWTNLECDAYITYTKYGCLQCKRIWIHNSFFKSWTSEDGKLVKGGKS